MQVTDVRIVSTETIQTTAFTDTPAVSEFTAVH